MNTSQEKPLIIFDTDMETDCDDAGALAMLLQYVLQKKADLLGIIADSASPYAAACCEVFCRTYSVTCPIGTVYASDYPDSETDRLTCYRTLVRKHAHRLYNRILADQIGKKDTDYPHAAVTYRSLLASAPDKSVSIVCVGFLTALATLLASQPDHISPLSGESLLQKKAKKIIVMGYLPSETAKGTFNWEKDREAACFFLENCPIPIHISEAGSTVITGKPLPDHLPENHPLRISYKQFTGADGIGRSSWDLIALLYALEPETPLLKVKSHASCRYDSQSLRSYWVWDSGRFDYEILPTCSDETLADYLDKQMLGTTKEIQK